MSGRYPFHFGFYSNQDANAYGLATNFTTLPELLKAAGYSTHMVGKWHLGMRSEALTPTRRGFETWLGYYQHGEDYFTHVFSDSCGRPGVDFSNATTDSSAASWALGGKNGSYSAYVFAAEAERRIRLHAAEHGVGKPLYLYVPMQSVHAPAEVPPQYVARYDGVIDDPHRKELAGMITCLDEAVANITSALEDVGMWRDTFLMFSSDNGGPLPTASNYPLRGGKFTYWEGGVRIQAFFHTPRTDILPAFMAGSVWDGIGHTVDVMPTFLAVAGVPFDPASTLTPGSQPIPFDGLNLLPAIQTNATSPRTEVVHMVDNAYNSAICNESTGVGGQNHCGAALRVGDFKLLVGYPGDAPFPAIPPPRLGDIPQCSPTKFLNGTALHVFKDQLRNFSETHATACCTACAADNDCSAWTLQGDMCYLKKLGAKQSPKSDAKSVSGIKIPANDGCNTTTGYGCPCNPPSKGCLFNVRLDPNEQVDLADDPAHAADFARLLARLTEVSRTGVIATAVMLGKARGHEDSEQMCAQVKMTGFYEPWALHVPYLPYPGPGSSL